MNKEQRNHRARQLNPQDRLGKAAGDNRANQMNPNHPAPKPANPGNAPQGRAPGSGRP